MLSGIIVFLLLKSRGSGSQVFGATALTGLWEQVKFLQDVYVRFTQLITASFGAAAFLLTYIRTAELSPPPRAWAFLAAGLTFWIGALAFTLLGTEALLYMIGVNAVELNDVPVVYARYASYSCFAIGLALVGRFAIEIPLSPRTRR